MVLAIVLLGCVDAPGEADTAETLAPDTGDSGSPDSGSEETGALDLDEDADGFGADVDCDDANAWVHPGARERCDAVDQDCDGEPLAAGACAAAQYAAGMWVASWVTPEEWADASFGLHASRETSDLDGDGIDDFMGICDGCVEAEYGVDVQAAVLVSGRTELAEGVTPSLSTDTWFYGGGLDWDLAYNPAPAADFDGDGVSDLVFSSEDNDMALGAVWVLLGPSSRWGPQTFVRDAADLTWSMSYGDTHFATDGVQGGDLDGDGDTDLLVSARGDGWPGWAPTVYVLPGGADRVGPQLLEDEPSVATHAVGSDFGVDIFVPGDLDGDGSDEVLIDDILTQTAYLFYGLDLLEAHDADVADLAIENWGPWIDVTACHARIGDLDGDGYPEWLHGDTRPDGGVLYVLSGIQPGSFADLAERSSAWWYGATSDDDVGDECWTLDFDGDGQLDLAHDDDTILRIEALPVGGEPLPAGLTFTSRDDEGDGPQFRGPAALRADPNGDGFDDLFFYTEFGDRTGIAMVPGWAIPWDEPEWWR